MACSHDVKRERNAIPVPHFSLYVAHLLLLLHFSFDFCYIMVIFPMSHFHDGKCLKSGNKTISHKNKRLAPLMAHERVEIHEFK